MTIKLRGGQIVARCLFDSTYQILYYDDSGIPHHRIRYVNTDEDKVIRDDPLDKSKTDKLLNSKDFKVVKQ